MTHTDTQTNFWTSRAAAAAKNNFDCQVMARVDEVLHNLDQLNLCVSLLRQTGAYHRRFQGFKPKYFKVFAYKKVYLLIYLF